jgi:hypothetical protein
MTVAGFDIVETYHVTSLSGLYGTRTRTGRTRLKDALLMGECSPACRGIDADASEADLTLSPSVPAFDGFTVGWAIGLAFGLAVSGGFPSGDSATGANGALCSPDAGATMLDMEGEGTGAREGSVGCLAVFCPGEGEKPAVGSGGRVGIRSGGNVLGMKDNNEGVKDGSAVDFLVSWVGDELGNDDGARVGATVGTKVGAALGDDVGDDVGWALGRPVGCNDGLDVG